MECSALITSTSVSALTVTLFCRCNIISDILLKSPTNIQNS
jgi:hypothetical protein